MLNLLKLKALPEPIAFLITQGISTSPATGSQTKPNKLLIANAIACPDASGDPPKIATAAAAAIADAEPTSAGSHLLHQLHLHCLLRHAQTMLK